MTKEVLKLALEALEADELDMVDDGSGNMVFRKEQAIAAIKKSLAQPEQEPKFFTHNVEQPHDWSEWVCPDPKGYLMKCCDCGLVHEAEFGVVRFKSETEREDCEPVNDPNLQAVFRMRRSEQWSPEDTAHRAGGLPMEQSSQQEPVAWEQFHEHMAGPFYKAPPQPEKEPVAWGVFEGNLHDMFFSPSEAQEMADLKGTHAEVRPLYTTPPQRKPLTDEDVERIVREARVGEHGIGYTIARAIEAAHGIKE